MGINDAREEAGGAGDVLLDTDILFGIDMLFEM